MRIQDFDIIIGDTAKIAVAIKDSDGEALDITGYTGTDIVFTLYDSDEEEVLVLDLDDGITITEAEDGEIEIVIPNDDTAELNLAVYTYTVVVEHESETFTVTAGTINAISARPAPSYCQPQDVAALLRLKDEETDERLIFSPTTRVTDSEIEDWIDEAEEFIETQTNHAWREKYVVNEYHRYEGRYDGLWPREVPLCLAHRCIRALDADRGDKLELWDRNGASYTDLLDEANGYAENTDFSMNYEGGVLVLHTIKPYTHLRSLRASYRYGEDRVPYDIRMACVKLVAIRYLETDIYRATVPTGPGVSPSKETIMERWQADVDKVIERRKEWSVVNL